MIDINLKFVDDFLLVMHSKFTHGKELFKMNKLINKYVFSGEKIADSLIVIKIRVINFIKGVESRKRKDEYLVLYEDYLKLALAILEPSDKEYSIEYFQYCIDAMTEINFRMLELERECLKNKKYRKIAEKAFAQIRNDISTFSGMKKVILRTMVLIMLSVTLLKILKYGFSIYLNKLDKSEYTLKIMEIVFSFGICIIPTIICYTVLIPWLKQILLKERVQRANQRDVLLQILTIFITIFIAILI